MYVAITRAKKELVLSYVKSRYVFGDYQMQMPSRFLKELPESEITFEEVFFGSEYLSGNRGENSGTRSFNNFQKNQLPTKTYKKTEINFAESTTPRRVFHQKFGYGKVLNVDGNKLEISFEKAGTKIVMKDFVTAA